MIKEKIKTKKFRRTLKENYPSIKFKQLEEYNSLYQSRFYSRMLGPTQIPNRDLGYNGTRFLLNSLQRSRFLFLEYIDNINRDNVVSAFLLTRGHFESTASVAYFLHKFFDSIHLLDLYY